MDIVIAGILMFFPLLLLGLGGFNATWVNTNLVAVKRWIPRLAAGAFLVSVVGAGLLVSNGPVDQNLVAISWPVPLSFGVYFDSLSAVMLLLVSFIGVIITRYSVRYLDGDATQGRFMKWIGFTIGAVLLMIVSNNIAMFTAGWVLTSFGLHQLLTHYADRPLAALIAQKKFLISRLGDAMLIVAMVMTYQVFGSFEYSAIFAAVDQLRLDPGADHWKVSVIGLLYVFGAMTKSAQFPFHSWLPDTMEAPTPVSALMHAGVINAGGFLIIRLSPLVSLSSIAFAILAVVGTITALFAVTVMLTQTSVKRSLAYSTVAQMGFMMLQCGLGAFSAALLHIVAHSLYKAHAFLSSGTLVRAESIISGTASHAPARRMFHLLAAAAVSIGLCVAAGMWLTLNQTNHGGIVLGVVVAAAITHLLWRSFETERLAVVARGVVTAVLVLVIYHAAFIGIDQVLSTSVSHAGAWSPQISTWLLITLAVGFVSVIALQLMILLGGQSSLMKAFYVHASHGFYVDIATQRWTQALWSRIFSRT